MEDGVKNIQFADDVTIYFASRNIAGIESKLNATMGVTFDRKLSMNQHLKNTPASAGSQW